MLVGGVVFWRGRKTCDHNSPVAAMVGGYSLVSDSERPRRFMAQALWPEKALGQQPAAINRWVVGG